MYSPNLPHLHPGLNIDNISLPDSTAPIPVQQHVESLNALISEIRSEEQEGSSETHRFMREFANRHDVGYATDISMIESDSGQQILRTILDEMNAEAGPRQITDYLRRNGNANNYLATRVIGHGVLGLVHNTLHYQKRGLSKDKALGMAAVMAAHHPGFPITMVSDLLSGDDATIQDEMRSGLFIDDGGVNPEAVRGRLIDVAANKLRLPYSEVATAAILGYSLDRITPGKVPDEIIIREDGSTQVIGGEVVQKKYGLVAKDITRNGTTEKASIALLYATVIDRLTAESQAAIQVAQSADQLEAFTFIDQKAQDIIGQTKDVQDKALTSLRELGLSSSFEHLQNERTVLLEAARTTEDPRLRHALATYDAVTSALLSGS